MRGARWLALGLLVSFGLGGTAAARLGVTSPGTRSQAARVDEDRPVSETAERAPSFRLGEAVGSGAPGVATAERPSAELLSETEARRVLDRLPPLPDPPRAVPFARREDSLPAPRAGRTVEVPFPPAASAARPDAAAAGPLEVLRRAPEGDVALAPTLSVTFSQPMVALDTQDALGRETVPVRLEPKVPGEWRWVGARTVVFQPEGRFPMATEFRAAVPAGTSSATGGILARDVAWSFATPPPRVVARHPDGAVVRRDAIVFVAFDQDVNPPAVLASTHARAAAATVALRLATEAEVANDAAVARLVKDAARGRWVALAPTAPFPPDAAVEVSVGPGTPSAEGKRRTSESQSWSFRTYGPFRVKSHECGGGGRCTPLAPWRIETTNPVDPRSLRPDLVRVSPELPGLKLSGWGSQLVVNGMSKGRTTYGVTLSPEIRDAFGQPLEESAPMTFAVGRAEPSLAGPRGEFVVLDPAGPRRVPVYSVGHAALRARVFAVTPSDWPAWHKYRQASWRDESAVPPGRAVVDATVRVEGAGDELVETAIDLAPALADGVGQAVVVVEPVSRSREARRQAVRAWVQSTRLGLDALVDGESLLAWATALADGRPQEGVEVSLAGGATARTDAAGLARLALPDTAAPLLVARLGRDVAVLPSNAGGWSEGQGYRRVPFRDALRYFVFDDRKMYRPGEEARLKGWVRRVGTGPRGDVEPAPAGLDRVSWALRDSRGNEVGRGESRLSATGAFDLTLKLPATMNLGPASVLLAAPGAALEGSQHAHALQVQEFRRPEFEVKAQSSEGPHVSAGHATVSVSATYYAGGALPDADVSWRVVSRPGHFRPPNRDEFTFGTFVPWWRPWPGLHEPAETATFAGRTDSAGVHRVRIDFDPQPKPRPRQVEAEATVMDVNRQAWAARAPLLVHPALHYVGLRAERPFVRKGESLELDVVVTDLDGRAVAGRRVALRAERLDWEQIAGEWKEVPKDAQERSLDSGPEPTRVRFEAREGGSWRVVARVSDEAGRANETEMPLWVAGGRVPPRRDLDEETVTIVPDRREYRRGDVARLLVLAPFAPAEALVTLRRSGLVREQRLRIEEASKEIEVPVEEGFTPNVHVNVALVGQAARDAARPGAPTRPAFASGTIDLPVPPLERTLAVDVRPREAAIAPGGETVIDLALRDAAGRPAGNAEATVVVVDEAVLALTGYQRPDPLGVFYAHRDDAVSDHRLRRDVILASPEDLAERMEGGVPGGVVGGMVGGVPMEAQAMAAPAPMAARTRMAKDEAAPEPIRARTDFAALALFAATLPTDADGRARVSVKLPDSLTRYRVMAVAASGARQFGSAEATLVARLPLMVRPSPPRFLNFGDRFDLPVVVQNQTDRAMTVDVAVRARNAVLTAGSGRRLSVPANDRAEVRFPMAAVLPGSARVQVGAASGGAADAAEVELPVWTPATTEAFATYGQVDAGSVAQPVKAPANVEPSVGGLEVTTSSTALQALTDAVLYLVAYPFECAEQLSSRVLAVAALRDVLAAFGAEGLPKPGEIEVAVRRDLDRLRALQNDDGGFGFWRRGDESWPYVSIHVANALARARAKGFEVPAPMLERSHGYLRDIDRHIPSRYPRDVKRTLRAYALHVRALLGAADPAAARGLVREAGVEGLSFEALGFVLPVLAKDGRASAAEVAAIRRRIANGVTETAGGAHFTVSYEDGAHLLLHSDRRADAILLEALVADQPGSDVIPKLATGLLAHRTAGRWTNTQENVFVLLALDRYFQAYEKTTPDFVARAWLGERYAGEQPFRGRSTDRRHVVIPMTELGPAGSTSDLVLAKDGPGRLYYRIGLRYAPRSLVLDPLDRGFTIERAYQGLDDAKDVRRESDGTWRIRAGARVRVVLTMIAPARRYHVALVDPLPAGLEAVNPALAVAERVPEAGGSDVVPLGATGLGGRPGLGSWRWWSRPWFDHQNLRDERVEAFSSLLWEGVHEYRYVARATTPGTFVVPPTKVEEMYAPETFGRSRTDRVVVE
jgi:hypothetical protein